jgi:hypothetical protein
MTPDSQDASTIRANPKVNEFYERLRSEALLLTRGSTTKDDSEAQQISSMGMLDTLKSRLGTLMAAVQTNIEDTVQGAAQLLPISYPSLTPQGGNFLTPLKQHNANTALEECQSKRQKCDTTQEASSESAAGCPQQQPVQHAIHCCTGVAGEKLTWIGAGSLMSACNCLMMLKQVIVCFILYHCRISSV